MATKSSYDALKRRVSSKRTGKASYEDLVGNVAKKRYSEDVKKVDSTYINSFLQDAGSFMSDSQKELEGMTWAGSMDSGARETRYGKTQDLGYRAKLISYYLENNKDRLDQDIYSKLSKALGEYQTGFTQVDEAFGNASKFFSQFSSEEDYTAWETKESFISAYLENPENATKTLDYEDGWLQEAKYRAETSKALEAEDFKDFSGYAKSTTDNWWDKLTGKDYDETYEYVNNQDGFRDEYKRKHTMYSSDNPFSDGESTFEEKGYDFMTEDEIAVYNYYYAKEGKDRADAYLETIEDILVQRKAGKEFSNLEGNLAKEYLYGIVAGTEQFASGIENFGAFFTGNKGSTPSSQYVSGMIREDLADDGFKVLGSSVGQVGYDLINTGANMLPSILVSAATGQVGGLAAMGASIVGNGYKEMVNLGYDTNQARAYGLMVGAAEVGLQYLLGGISKLGGKLSGNVVSKVVSKVDNAIAKVAIDLGGKMLSEGVEEAVQSVLEPVFKAIVTGEDFEGVDLEEVVYSGLLGALSAGVMESGGTVAGNISANQEIKQTYGDGKALVGEALEIDPGNTFAQEMQGRLDSGKNISGGQMLQMHNQIVSSDVQAIQSAAAQRLTELGETGNVDAIAAALAKQAAGEELSKSEERAISKSKYGSRVANELNTENINSGTYASGWAEKIGTHRINAQEYSRMLKAAETAQEGAETAEGKIVTQVQNEAQQVKAASAGGNVVVAENATTEGSSVAEDGVTRQVSTDKAITPQKIVSISGGKVMIQTDNGTIAADDIQFGTKDADLLWRSAANFQGITPAGANGIIHAYRSGDSATDYIKGAAQEFRNGYYNMESGGEDADKLTSGQREIIYRLGQKAAGENTAKAQAKATAAKNSSATVSESERVGKVHFDRKGRTFDQKRETALKTMEQLSKVLGVEFHVYESYVNKAGKRVYRDANGNEKHAPNGWYDPSDGSIHIDLNAGADGKGTMLFTIAHELTHFIWHWSPAKFKVLANFLVAQYGEKGVSVEELVQRQIAKAKRNGRTIDYDTAFEDMVADSMETMLTDGNVQQKMADLKRQDKRLWQKICQWFKDLAADIKALVNAYKGVEPDSLEGRMVAQMQDVITILEALYADALMDAGANFQAARAQKNTTQEGGVVKFSLRGENKDGIEVYETSEEIKKLPYKERQKRFLDIMMNEYRGRTAKFIRNGHAYYATFDEKDVNKNIYGDKLSDPKGWKAKINVGAEGNIFELVENAQYDGSKPEKGKKIAAHQGVGYWDYFIKNVQIDDTVFDLLANVRKKADGAYVYSIQLKQNKNIEASPPRGSLLRASSGVPNASENNVAQDGGDVKEKFSLRDTVEETKDLVAVHNLTEEKLIKSLRLGGLPMPSIAIIRAQDGHSTFGTISLVFGKDTIDPKAYRTNKLYSGDAWTPTYPSVDYKVSDKVRKSISDKIGKLVPYEIRDALGGLHLDSSNMENTLNRYGGNMVDAFRNDEVMKYAYLKDTGADIALPMKEKDLAYYGSISNEAVRYFSGKLVNGLQTVDMYQNMHSKKLLEDKALTEAVADAYNWDVLRTLEPGSEEYQAYEQKPLFQANDIGFSDIDTLLSATRTLFTSGAQQTVDYKAAKSLIKDNIDQGVYEAWLKELFSGIVEKEGIRNDKDYFTPSGNRRSFEALHYEHNLENVIKAMREKGEKGIAVFGGGSIFGAATTEFSSIEEMKQAGDRLKQIPEEEYQQMRDAFSKRFFELASSLPNNKNSFTATDDAANMLVEAVTRYTTKSGMANYIRRESQGWATYSDYVVDDLIELVRDIRNMPTGYFEAKPRRAVGFDEVATAIVPDSVSDDLRSKMEDMGIPFVEYAAGDEEARKTALNSIEGVKFSDRDSDGNELSKEQQEYFKDSKVRDEQGRLLTMYHGTPNGGFTKFRSGTYFTQNPGYADVYQNPGASSISTKKGAEAPMTYKVYLNIKKPFDTRNAKERRIFQQEFYRKYGTGTPLADSGLPDWVDGMDLQEFIEEMEYDYDGLILDEGGVGGYGDEVKSRGLSYVVFDPAQVKNVENKAPTNDPDIRYSERDPELEKVNQVLEKENTQLKHDVAYLKELLKLQKQTTGGTKFTKSSVEAAAGQLMKYASAKGDKAELAGLLNGLYEYIAGSKELTWDGVKEAAQPAVDWLQDHVNIKAERSAYAKDVLKEIQGSKVYLDEQQKKEVAYQYGSYNEFRKRAMGSVILTDNATMSLDSQWHEWAGEYPNLFDPDITSTDMPAALMDVFDSLRNMTETDYGYDRELFSQELLSQVYDSYWRVSTLRTVADKAQKQINKLKFEHAGRMATLKKYHTEQTAKLKDEHREALQKVKQAERERFEQKLQETQERYQESRKKGVESRRKTEMRRKIRRTIMDLKKILNKGDKKRNVKEDMKDLVAQALKTADILFTDNYTEEGMIRNGVGTEMTEQEAKYMSEAQAILAEIDSAASAQERLEAENRLKGKLDYRIGKLRDVFTREKARLNKTKVSEVLGDLADAYQSLENSEYDYVKGAFDENVYQYLTGLKSDVGGTIVKDMSLNQLEELHKAYTMVLTTVRNANKMFAANLKKTREQLGNQTIGEVKQAGGEHGLWLPGEDKVNAFSWNNQKPVYAFERIGSPTLTQLFENTRAGEDRWAQDMTEAREYYLAQTRKHKYDSWDFEKQYKFTSTSGIDFSLNLEQIMSLYAYSKREQAHDHLLKGGFVFDGNTEVQVNKMGIKVTYLNKTAKAHNVSMESLAQIVGKLTPEQKAFVDEMQDYLSTTMGGKGNEVSMEMYGVKLFNEKHYFPLRSAGQYMARAKEADLKKQQGQISIVNSGFTKATTPKSSNPVVLSGFMDVWADHVNEMSMYHSFVLPMEDFRRVYNYSSPNMETGQSVSVNSVIQDAYGEAATGYIDQLYRDLNGGAISDPRDNPIKALMGKFKKAAVFTSLSVVIQQPSAIGRAFAIIDPKYFIGGKVDSKRHKALWAELKKYAPVAAIKEMGYFDTGMGKSAKDFIKGKEYGNLKEKAAALFTDANYRDEVLSKAPALADELTWCVIWEAAKRETKAKNPKLDVKSEEFLQAAGKRFTEVITKTQVYDSVLSRSANMRSKGLMTMWTAFMAEPTTTINMVEDALRKGKKGNKQYAARAMGAVMTSIVLNSLLSSLVYAMRDDDEDETFLEKYAQSFATEILDGINPITYYPFLKDVWSALQGFDIERSDMSLITSLVEKVTKLVQVLSKDTNSMDEAELEAHNKRLADAWWGVVDYVTALAGVPVKNVRRDINGAMNTYKTIAADLTDRDTSWGSLLDKVWSDVKNALPVVGWLPDKAAADKLYKATVSGDTAYQKRLESGYSSKTSLDNAIRKGLRANDSRIWEAALCWNNNDLEGYMRIAKQIKGEGHFSQDNIVAAIQAEAKAMIDSQSSGGSESKAKGYFTADKFAVAIGQGNGSMAATIKTDIIETAMANGKTEEEAEESFRSSAKSSMKEMFLEGGITKAQASKALVDHFGISKEDAKEDVQYWSFQKQYPAYDLSEAAVTKYYEYAEPAGIGADAYYEYYTKASACESDLDENGKAISGSKKAKIMDVIDAMKLTKAQKDALYYANGWAKSTINEAPWH